MNETRTQGEGTIRSSQTANKPRTFRAGVYLDSLFRAAERMDAELQAEICARIKQARVEAGFTQDEAADALGMTQRGYQNYESVRVPFRKMTRISEVFGVSERWLYRGESEPPQAEVDVQLAAILRRLESLEAKVSKLPTGTDVRRGLETLREAIDAQASRGTRRASKSAAG